MRHRTILAMASMLAAVGGTSLNKDYRPHEPAPEPRRRLPSPGRLWSEENGYNDEPPIWRPQTRAERKQERRMERRWRRAAALYPDSPAAMAIYHDEFPF